MIESVIKKATKKENLTYEEARMTMTELHQHILFRWR